jgi:hypothetical protein
MKESEMTSGVFLYTQKNNRGIQYLVMISGYSPFLQIDSVFYLTLNQMVSKNKLRGNEFEIEKLDYGKDK